MTGTLLERITPSLNHRLKNFARLLFAAVLLLLTRPCFADDIDEARVAFRRAVELFGKEEYEDALATFEESYALYPRHSTLFNLGMCHKALGHYREAVSTFKRFLKADLESSDGQMRQEARVALDELLLLVGMVRLSGVPAEAIVTVNDVSIGLSELDEPLPFNPGQSVLLVTRDGYEPFEASVNIVAGSETTIEVVLEAEETLPPDTRAQVSSIRPPEETALTPAPESAADKDSSMSPLLLSGLITGGAGLVAVGIGGYFNYQYFDHWEQGKQAAADWDETRDPSFKEKYLDIANTELPADKKGLIAGYVCGGVLITAGIMLVILDVRSGGETKTSRAEISFGAGELVFLF